MKTLLINPPYPFTEFPIIPMGLLYISGILEHNGHEVGVLDLLVSKYSKEKIKHKIEQYQPDIVGITCVTMNYPAASEILKQCKSVNKDIITVIGGPHVTFAPVETLTEAPWIDIVVRREGDYTILDIVNGKKLSEIDGIAYREKDGSIKLTRERALIENLDELPFPARHLFQTSRYLALDAHASIVAGRGCPFNCIFCVGSKMGGRRGRFRNPKLILDEVEQALGYGFKEVNFEDDLLTLNHKHLHAVCDEIISRGLKFNWSAFARVDTVNPDILKKMREAGCTWVSYGVESGNQQILDIVKKKITLDKVREAVKMAKDADIKVLASFIIGLPGETRETLKDTMDFAQELQTFYGFHVLAPFPGSEVREEADKYGIEILTSDWARYDANRAVTRTKGASPDDINAVLHKYFQGLKQPLPDPAKPRVKSPLAWTLMLRDIIESLGPVSPEGDPIEDLVQRLADIILHSREQISKGIRDWYNRSLLKYDLKDGQVTWRWS